jgi:hypothetical protein
MECPFSFNDAADLFFVVFIIRAALLRRHELHIAKILKIFQKNIFLNIFKQNKKNEGKI